MIEKVYGKKFEVTCDNCGEGEEWDSWEDAMNYLKNEGWQYVNKNGSWFHYCPECQEG